MGRLINGPDRGHVTSCPFTSPLDPVPTGSLDFNPLGVASIDTGRTSPAVVLPLTARSFPNGSNAFDPPGDAKRARQSPSPGRTGGWALT